MVNEESFVEDYSGSSVLHERRKKMRKLINIATGISWFGFAAFIVTTAIEIGLKSVGYGVDCFKA